MGLSSVNPNLRRILKLQELRGYSKEIVSYFKRIILIANVLEKKGTETRNSY